MKISYNWLKQYVDIAVSPEKTAELLTDTGLEVEGIETVESIAGGLQGLIIGEVKSAAQHPNADRLKVTTVDVGSEELLPIVCGAPNVVEGQKVVIAPVGSTIHPLTGDPFKIKKSKIRGEVSEGMICAEDEIGLGEDHDGIMVLPADAPVGTEVRDFLDVEVDTVFDIGLTPNRADATSHIGVARDLVSVFRVLHKLPSSLKRPEGNEVNIESTPGPVEVVVEDTEACPRYAGLSIVGVTVAPSPDWLQFRLRAIGLKPINNVVDVTNYVLHEMGQPLHAFDADQIGGNKVVVRKAKQGESFVTLDEMSRSLDAQDLMICDAEKGMCIAGVFGGIHSGVKDQTKNIFLESAYFNPVSVRKTAKRHALNTDASFRFERGIDPAGTVDALKRSAQLILELAGGKIAGELIDIYPQPIEDHPVDFRYAQCDRIIGQSIDRGVIRDILESLEIRVNEETAEGLSLTVPAYRVDVLREIDVIEEVLRIYGYNQVALPEKMNASLSYRQHPDPEQLLSLACDFLSAHGYREMLSNSLTNEAYYGTVEKERLVRIQNPLSSELEVLRPTLMHSGLEAIAHNRNRQQEDLRFYEIGKTYRTGDEGGFEESQRLSLFLTGRRDAEHWRTSDVATDVYDLKGLVDALLDRFGLKGLELEAHGPSDHWNSRLIYRSGEEVLVELGSLHTDTLEAAGVKSDVLFADVDWSLLVRLAGEQRIQYQPVSKYPAVRRDFALLVDAGVLFSSIKALAEQTEKQILKSVHLFDVYDGKGIEPGKKSYAVSFTFQDVNKTLTDKRVDKTMSRLQAAFEQELGAAIR